MTDAERALEGLKARKNGPYTGDWWNECIDVHGYDSEITDYVDNEQRSEIALYKDGSYLRLDETQNGGPRACLCEKGGYVSEDDIHLARWTGDHWQKWSTLK